MIAACVCGVVLAVALIVGGNWLAVRKDRHAAKVERLNVRINGERHYPRSIWN